MSEGLKLRDELLSGLLTAASFQNEYERAEQVRAWFQRNVQISLVTSLVDPLAEKLAVEGAVDLRARYTDLAIRKLAKSVADEGVMRGVVRVVDLGRDEDAEALKAVVLIAMLRVAPQATP